jgi:hypothetical protein
MEEIRLAFMGRINQSMQKQIRPCTRIQPLLHPFIFVPFVGDEGFAFRQIGKQLVRLGALFEGLRSSGRERSLFYVPHSNDFAICSREVAVGSNRLGCLFCACSAALSGYFVDLPAISP